MKNKDEYLEDFRGSFIAILLRQSPDVCLDRDFPDLVEKFMTNNEEFILLHQVYGAYRVAEILVEELLKVMAEPAPQVAGPAPAAPQADEYIEPQSSVISIAASTAQRPMLSQSLLVNVTVSQEEHEREKIAHEEEQAWIELQANLILASEALEEPSAEPVPLVAVFDIGQAAPLPVPAAPVQIPMGITTSVDYFDFIVD